MEKYAVSRMIGSPPGYVGYEEAGQLTEKVRRRPYSVVLFDEIEKAHPDVMNILLQILDEGKINDAQGRTVDFSNTVICMTSNAGSSDQTTASLGFNRSEEERNEEKSRKALSQFLRPEFLGRVDEVITFKPLSEETLQGIAALMLDEYKPSMEPRALPTAIPRRHWQRWCTRARAASLVPATCAGPSARLWKTPPLKRSSTAPLFPAPP